MHFKPSLATAALAAAGATALNTHRHRHDERAIVESHPHLRQERILQERALVYKHTATQIVTETVTFYVTVDPPKKTVAPTVAFFEPASDPAAQPAVDATAINHGVPDAGAAEETPAPVENQPQVEVPVVEPAVTSQAPAESLNPESSVQEPAPSAPEPEQESTPVVEAPSSSGDLVTPELMTSAKVEAPATSKTVTSPPASGNGGPACKRGISYNNVDLAQEFTSSGKVCWGYNWGSDGSLNDGAMYIPTLWGNKPSFFDVWESNVALKKKENPSLDIVFSFNEPDLLEQSGAQLNDHGVAAAAHIEKMGPLFSQGWKVGAPSITSDFPNTSRSWSWLEGFLDVCNSQAPGAGLSTCPISFINTHYYEMSGDCPSDGFKQYITELSSRFPGYPVWVTEVQATGCDQTNQMRFIQEISEWMDKTAVVEGYAYFYGDGVLTDGNSLSTLGRAYVDA